MIPSLPSQKSMGKLNPRSAGSSEVVQAKDDFTLCESVRNQIKPHLEPVPPLDFPVP